MPRCWRRRRSRRFAVGGDCARQGRNPDVGSAAAAEREAAERVTQVRGGYFPKVDVAESWQRGDHPVFVFSSLLAQRQFSAADFALDALNHPAATENFRAALSVEQSLFDRTTSANVRAASVRRDMAATGRQLVDQDLTSAVTDAFGRVLIAAATARSAAAMVETARADRELAGNRRDAGRVTDADVLQLDVYLARTLEQQVQATSDERIARTQLNQLMGEPLSTRFSLDLTPPAIAIDITNPAEGRASVTASTFLNVPVPHVEGTSALATNADSSTALRDAASSRFDPNRDVLRLQVAPQVQAAPQVQTAPQRQPARRSVLTYWQPQVHAHTFELVVMRGSFVCG